MTIHKNLNVHYIPFLSVENKAQNACSNNTVTGFIHPAAPPCLSSPAAATILPLHVARVGGDGGLPLNCSPFQGQIPGSDETSAGSTPRRLAALPGQISDQCNSCEHIQYRLLNSYNRLDLIYLAALRTQYLGPEEKGMKA